MIKVIKGNILEASENIIGHQVNCQGAFNSGLAKQIRYTYPVVAMEYMNYCAGSKPSELKGKLQVVKIAPNKYCVNIFGQLYYGRNKDIVYTDYVALREGLISLYNLAKQFNLTVALPYKIGCGLANGDWEGVVYPMIEEVFNDYDVTLYNFSA